MAGMKEQQFIEEKPLLPETRGQETEMVCVCVFLLHSTHLNIVDEVKIWVSSFCVHGWF